MKTRLSAICVFTILLLVSIAHMVYYYPLLPGTVASHFGPSGEPNDWMSKQVFIGVYAGIVTLMGLIFFMVKFFYVKTPTYMINLPNKDYWFSPELKKETCVFISDYVLWFVNASIALIIASMHLAFRVNLRHSPTLENTFWLIFSAYLIFITVWTVGWFLKFKRKS